MRGEWAVAAALAAFFVGVFAAATIFDPASRASKAQRALLDEYLKVYCVDLHAPGLTAERRNFLVGEAAALSRATIAAGLGPLSLAEYAKCKLGGS